MSAGPERSGVPFAASRYRPISRTNSERKTLSGRTAASSGSAASFASSRGAVSAAARAGSVPRSRPIVSGFSIFESRLIWFSLAPTTKISPPMSIRLICFLGPSEMLFKTRTGRPCADGKNDDPLLYRRYSAASRTINARHTRSALAIFTALAASDGAFVPTSIGSGSGFSEDAGFSSSAFFVA